MYFVIFSTKLDADCSTLVPGINDAIFPYVVQSFIKVYLH